MTFREFINQFDHENSIVLLEGKRNVLENDKPKLVELGKLLASETRHIIFRSGNAVGADQLFSDGVTMIDHKRLQVITPYSGHRKKTNNAYKTISLNDMKISAAPEVLYQSKSNKKMITLIDQYVSGEINPVSIKAAYIIRDTVKVMGINELNAASFGIFYDDLKKPQTGGTGHTMNVCKQKNVPFINQLVWFSWLTE